MLHPYIRLIRLDKPTGIWLLLWPCWWSVLMAMHELLPLKLLLLFLGGAILMRSAGCVFNDIADRHFDAQVERTRTRPLASGEVSLIEAASMLALLLFLSLDIVIQMNRPAIYLAIGSLVLVAAYPFMKRITWWPQAFLGLTFNWGALMGWGAATGKIELPAVLLYLGGIGWTLGYDTIYAHQDKEDDLKIGVKSTALKLGAKTKPWLMAFYGAAIVCWSLAGAFNHSGPVYFLGIAAVAIQCYWQVSRVKLDDSQSCLRVFRSNTMLGWILFMSIWLDTLWMIVTQL